MKRFLKLHFTMEDTLRAAARDSRSLDHDVIAGELEHLADEIKNYRPDKRYVCHGFSGGMSSLRAWQRNTLRIAEPYNDCIFTRQEIEHLTERLVEFAQTQKNVTEKIRGPRFEDEERFGLVPGISIGNGCSISFIPIKGDYEY